MSSARATTARVLEEQRFKLNLWNLWNLWNPWNLVIALVPPAAVVLHVASADITAGIRTECCAQQRQPPVEPRDQELAEEQAAEIGNCDHVAFDMRAGERFVGPFNRFHDGGV